MRIVQRGAVRPLITMLGADDAQLKEMAAFALGRLAQNGDNQAGIRQEGGLRPLLDLLDSRNGSLQHNAAFAIYGARPPACCSRPRPAQLLLRPPPLSAPARAAQGWRTATTT